MGSYVGFLPHKLEGIRGISLNNDIFVTGGTDGHHSYKAIYKYDKKAGEWYNYGELQKKRAYHAISRVDDICALEPFSKDDICGCEKRAKAELLLKSE